MVAVALAALQLSIYQFNLGPVQFNLAADRKWELTAQSDEVLIDLDRLKIRAARHDGTWSAAVLPFRDQGILPLAQRSKAVKLLIWPPEWLGAKALRVELEAQRPEYLWHERINSWTIETPYQEGVFKPGPGQRYIVIPTDAPPPSFRTSSGGPVEPKELAFRTLKLTKSDGNSHEFTVEATRQTVVLESPVPPIAQPWLDGITGQFKSFHQEVWLPFSGLSFTDGSGSNSLSGQPVTLQGTYSLAKPRLATASDWEMMADRSRPSLEPGLAVFSVGKGKGVKLKGMLMPSVGYFTNLFRNHDPVQDFKGWESWLPSQTGQPMTVLPGMNQMQVRWIMGPPLSESSESGPDTTWSYRVVPHHNIVFKAWKVVKVDIGRLP